MALSFVKDHHAYIYDRGGSGSPEAELEQMVSIDWNRVRDDISEASVSIVGSSVSRQADTLMELEPGRKELVIYRGDDRVWEGPLSRVRWTSQGCDIYARDIGFYLERTTMRNGYSNAYPNTSYAVNRLKKILQTELARKEAMGYNLLSHLKIHAPVAGDARTSRKTVRYEKQVFDELDDLAAKGGIDYTVLGRALHIWDTSRASMGQTVQVTEHDFIGEAVVTAYGMELGTHSYATDGQGRVGKAGGNSAYYGEWERLETAYDEKEGGEPPTQSELNSQAKRNLAGRKPTPVQVRVGENSQLNPNGVLTIEDLVPGVHIPLLANLSIRRLAQTQKLNQMKVVETSDGEVISVSMSPVGVSDDEAAGT